MTSVPIALGALWASQTLNNVSFNLYHYLLGYCDHEIQSVDGGAFQLTDVTNV